MQTEKGQKDRGGKKITQKAGAGKAKTSTPEAKKAKTNCENQNTADG